MRADMAKNLKGGIWRTSTTIDRPATRTDRACSHARRARVARVRSSELDVLHVPGHELHDDHLRGSAQTISGAVPVGKTSHASTAGLVAPARTREARGDVSDARIGDGHDIPVGLPPGMDLTYC
jgi:hypothetical protein